MEQPDRVFAGLGHGTGGCRHAIDRPVLGPADPDLSSDDERDERYVSFAPEAPLDHPDPLTPQQLAFHELLVSVEKPGRYDMVLLAGQDEIGRQPLLIGPAEVFRDEGA